MTPLTTVYFDTSFYVGLQRADADLARSVVGRLRDLGVRRVESAELFWELDVSPNLDGKRRLVDRLAGWGIPPLCLDGVDFSWLALAERPPEMSLSAGIKRRERLGHAWAASALRPVVPADVPLWEQAMGRTLGEDVVLDSAESMRLLVDRVFRLLEGNDIPAELAPLLGEMRDLFDRRASGELDERAFAETAARLPERVAAVAEALRPGYGREGNIRSQVLTANDRATNVALGLASERSERRYAATIEDLGHLNVFLRNLDRIDWLMMDGPATSVLDQRAAAAVGAVRHRIFCAADLAGVVEAIRVRQDRPGAAPEPA